MPIAFQYNNNFYYYFKHSYYTLFCNILFVDGTEVNSPYLAWSNLTAFFLYLCLVSPFCFIIFHLKSHKSVLYTCLKYIPSQKLLTSLSYV